jgi:hypothetical protein
MYLIKPLLLNHLAGNADLGKLVGTTSHKTGELTRAEIEAIRIYSTQSYTAMNAQLRSWLSEADAPMNVMDFDDFIKKQEPLAERRTTSELAVSGMNKLPPYKGIAYRGLVTEPGGYFDVIQPGATIVDLAFQSASQSMRGVEEFLATQTGSKHVYFMIHCKSPVNIMGISDKVVEGEILFKPGPKFHVKAVWHHVGGKVPPDAPPEAQLILHTRTEFKTGGLAGSKSLSTGLTSKEVDEDPFMSDTDRRSLKWHQVKVIEMVEV